MGTAWLCPGRRSRNGSPSRCDCAVLFRKRYQSAYVTQLRNPSGCDPLGDEDIAMLIKAGVVRMDEFTGRPTVGLGPDLETVEHLLGPLGVIAQVVNHLIVLVEKAHPGVQVGNQQHVTSNIEVSRKADVAVDALGLAVKGQVLKPRCRDRRRRAGARGRVGHRARARAGS